MRSLSPNVMQYVLQWLDLSSHLRLREASTLDRDETPRLTTTLVARHCEQARRCLEKIFTQEGGTRLHSVTLDLAAPHGSRNSLGGGRGGGGSRSTPPTPTQQLSFFSSTLASFLDEESSSMRRAAVPFLVREHRPAEIMFKNMIRGAEFSDALLSLEENLDQVRKDLRVLFLGLATGGPRPYQDHRSHQWCMMRLKRLLGPAPSGRGGGGGASGGGEQKALDNQLAAVTIELLGAVTAAARMPHLLSGAGFEGVKERTDKVDGGAGGHVLLSAPVVPRVYWPRLSELRLSCGIMAGDLEGLAVCLGSLPNLQILDLRGHSYRPPPTDLVAFARELRATASSARPTAPAHSLGRLRVLILKYFKVEGVAGVAALGRALSAERFPRLEVLSVDSCRLCDEQLRALASALPGMSRTLTSLSLRSNYALSAEGVNALAEALRAGSFPGPGAGSGCTCSAPPRVDHRSADKESVEATASSSANGSEDACSTDAPAGGSGGGATPFRGSTKATTKSFPEMAPAWSIPSSLPTRPPAASPSTPPHPASSCSPAPSYRCRWCRSIPVSSTAAVADGGDGKARTSTTAPLQIKSLDLSYSCWWNGYSRKERTGKDGPGFPFELLLDVLREGGACPSLTSLRLEGCYLGDAAIRQLVVALMSESGGCRELRVLNVNGNLFGEVGVRLIGGALLSGKMPPHLRMDVFCGNAHRQLCPSMPRESIQEIVELWVEQQKALRR